MTTLRKATQQALEALLTYEQYIQPLTNVFGGPRVPEEGSASAKVDAAITALRAALAKPVQEPVQEPVAWCNPAVCVPLYTAPPQRKPLTEDEIQQLLSKYERNYDMVNFARAIEKAHGIGDNI